MNPKDGHPTRSGPRKRFRLEKVEERVTPSRLRIEKLEERIAPSWASSGLSYSSGHSRHTLGCSY